MRKQALDPTSPDSTVTTTACADGSMPMSSTLPEIDAAIDLVDRELASLEQKRRALQAKKNRLQNQRSEASRARQTARSTAVTVAAPRPQADNTHRGKPSSSRTTESKASSIPLLIKRITDCSVSHRTFGTGRISLIEHRGPHLYAQVLFGISKRSHQFALASLLDPTFFESLGDDGMRGDISQLLGLMGDQTTSLTHDDIGRFQGKTIRLAGQLSGRVVVVNARFITVKLTERNEYHSFWPQEFCQSACRRHGLPFVRQVLRSTASGSGLLHVDLRPVKTSRGSSEVRSTHCWNCQHGISTLSNMECDACRGIICSCGACLCGYAGWRK